MKGEQVLGGDSLPTLVSRQMVEQFMQEQKEDCEKMGQTEISKEWGRADDTLRQVNE